LAEDASRRADEGRREADARAAALQAERDAAQHRAAEAVAVMGRLGEELQRQANVAAQQTAEAEQRAATAQAGRQKAEARLAQLEEQAKVVDEALTDPAELQEALTRAREAEDRAADAERLADEADRRANAANNRLDHFQRDRIAQAQAGAESTRIASQEAVPWWQRVFGRQR
jgi:hypothetical protein